MQLSILLPHHIFAKRGDVNNIIVETPQGSFGILPQRLDCVTPLSPGILTYETDSDGMTYIAVDEGVLVKTGEHVMISVRRAIRGESLSKLEQAVKDEFLNLDEQQHELHTVLAKLESGFLKQFSSLAKA